MNRWREVKMNLQVYTMPDDYKALSRISGVYFLVRRGIIDYIGRSFNIGNRLTSHHIFDRNYHDEIWVYPITPPDRLERWHQQVIIEGGLIKELRPHKNKAGLKHGL